MKRSTTLASLSALLLLLVAATAQAGEAIESLKGAWVVELSKGAPPPEGVAIVMTFVDDDTLSIEATFKDKTEKKDIKYTATADGKITLFPEPETEPEGEKANWQVKDDKKLYLTNEDGEELVLVRKS